MKWAPLSLSIILFLVVCVCVLPGLSEIHVKNENCAACTIDRQFIHIHGRFTEFHEMVRKKSSLWIDHNSIYFFLVNIYVYLYIIFSIKYSLCTWMFDLEAIFPHWFGSLIFCPVHSSILLLRLMFGKKISIEFSFRIFIFFSFDWNMAARKFFFYDNQIWRLENEKE